MHSINRYDASSDSLNLVPKQYSTSSASQSIFRAPYDIGTANGTYIDPCRISRSSIRSITKQSI